MEDHNILNQGTEVILKRNTNFKQLYNFPASAEDASDMGLIPGSRRSLEGGSADLLQ